MRTILLCSLVLLVMACTPQPQASNAAENYTVHGDASYRERMALPEGTILWVQLAVVDDKGRTLMILDESAQRIQGQVPVPFRLAYDSNMLHGAARYALSARFIYQGKTLFASPASPLNLPTDMPQHLVMRRQVEETPSGSFRAPNPNDLTGRLWELRTLYGTSVERFPNERIPSFSVLPGEHRIHGHDGCNGLNGSYTQNGDTLDIGQMASTMKMCFNGMDQARAMTTALQEADNWLISGNTLQLRHFDRVIAVFEGVAL